MKIFLLEKEPNKKGQVKLNGEDFHYLCRVKRLKAGDSFEVEDLHNSRWNAELLQLEEGSCLLQLIGKKKKRVERVKKIELFFCLPKGKKADLIVRQAVETGVDSIYPLLSENSLINLKGSKDKEKKRERWLRIVKEAKQQSGSLINTHVSPISDISELKKDDNCDIFFFHQDPIDESRIYEMIREDNGRKIGIITGPEGGFSPKEVERMLKCGFNPVYLGHNVLRAETAALYGISMVKTVLGEFHNE